MNVQMLDTDIKADKIFLNNLDTVLKGVNSCEIINITVGNLQTILNFKIDGTLHKFIKPATQRDIFDFHYAKKIGLISMHKKYLVLSMLKDFLK